MPLETLFLDAGGVLADPNWERVSAALARHGLSIEAAALRAAEPFAKRQLDRAEVIERSDDDSRGADLFHLVLGRVGVERSAATDAALVDIGDYHARYNLWESVPEEVPPSLERLARTGLPMAVVSNANGTIREHLRRLGLADYFQVIVDSHEEGVEKPDPRIFEVALRRCAARPETTLHVGDLFEIDVVGARAAGIEAVLLDVAGLNSDRDCRRLQSLTELAAAVERGWPPPLR